MATTGSDERHIVKKAQAYGASLAGIASVEALAASRSYSGGESIKCAVAGRTLLVLALTQGDNWPEFDWWDNRPGGTPGNRRLDEIMNRMVAWLAARMQIRSETLPYNIEKGGIFLKGAAVLAGLGIIGKNNLLITSAYGPRVRLRAILIERELTPTGPLESDPCDACDMACRRVCPQGAYDSGVFDRKRCSIQMRMDKFEAGGVFDQVSLVKYCRACELACPLASA